MHVTSHLPVLHLKGKWGVTFIIYIYLKINNKVNKQFHIQKRVSCGFFFFWGSCEKKKKKKKEFESELMQVGITRGVF